MPVVPDDGKLFPEDLDETWLHCRCIVRYEAKARTATGAAKQKGHMPAYRLLIEYEGTRYSGWQSQGNTPKTVQGKLMAAATEAFGAAEIGGAGRTDAGVHAAGQVAHLKLRTAPRPAEIAIELNDRLPHDIHVVQVTPADDRFHARHSAVSRVYLYQISTRRSAFGKPYVWWVRDRLDLDAMRGVAVLVPGFHDFVAFADKRQKNDSTQVAVESLTIERSDDLILVRIAASHFLWKMVRKLVAAFVEVGRGSMKREDFASRLESGGPRFEPTAPPSGLFLEAVVYPDELFDRPLEPIVPVFRVAPQRSKGKR